MAEAAATSEINPGWLDVARRLDPDKKIATIMELMAETNESIKDDTAIECNDGTSHKTTVRTGLPDVTWRKLNYGVQPSKSTTKQVTDATGMLEAYAEIDKSLADLNGNDKAWRLSEELAFLEKMNQEMEKTKWYGNTDQYAERYMGLAPRYAYLSTDKTKIGYNIISACSSPSGNDCTSIWLIVSSRLTAHGLYPKGSMAGFKRQFLGEVTLDDAAGGHYQGYRTHFKWDQGYSVRDWRYIVRIANIDISQLDKAGTNVDIISAMIDAYYRVPSVLRGRAAFYANNLILAWLHKQALSKTTLIRIDEVAGKPVVNLLGIPIRRSDQILNTESPVT